MEVESCAIFSGHAVGVDVMSNIHGLAMSVQVSGSSNKAMEAQRTQWV